MTAIYTSEGGGREIRRRYREALGAWPIPAEHLRVPTREGDTFVVSGPPDAPPLVLLHGSGANATMWTGDVPSWARHFRVHAVDLIGEPGLSAPSRPPLASEALALWLDDVLDDVLDGLGLTNPAFVGASLGGWVALDHATRRPDRIRRLALLCPGGMGRQTMGWPAKALLLRPFGRWGLRRSAQAATGLEAPDSEHVLDSLVLTFAHFKPRMERLPVFSDDALRRLTMPVLVIVGGRDAMFDSRDTARRARRCIPRATVTLLPEVGHAILGQTEPITEFLRG
ncbi:pimeloyl-ACP methyl ester carboxylesterase [Nocardiopsis mwathae]|uniref:Pimeloyl-ACP methyl ester carboxylesterase n=1 Tax=Nocardiopsis mwathae TaxID=1472723 RepID=A0A7W9YGB9_9ACTN|nr:alpha/beta fold hydrolase [Nocardiopsis mwathae]MBB6171638.1 pimeloyl-ACP methyl ester carboxylesterase [Nocardiopsis mwathae]